MLGNYIIGTTLLLVGLTIDVKLPFWRVDHNSMKPKWISISPLIWSTGLVFIFWPF